MRIQTRIAQIKLFFIRWAWIIAAVRNEYAHEALYKLNELDRITYQPPSRKVRAVLVRKRAIDIKYGGMVKSEVQKLDSIAIIAECRKLFAKYKERVVIDYED